jgi:hypothetical protein
MREFRRLIWLWRNRTAITRILLLADGILDWHINPGRHHPRATNHARYLSQLAEEFNKLSPGQSIRVTLEGI